MPKIIQRYRQTDWQTTLHINTHTARKTHIVRDDYCYGRYNLQPMSVNSFSSLFSSCVKCQFTLLIYLYHCNKIQRSRNMGESVSRIGFKREAGETAWNTGAPIKYGRSGSPTWQCQLPTTWWYTGVDSKWQSHIMPSCCKNWNLWCTSQWRWHLTRRWTHARASFGREN